MWLKDFPVEATDLKEMRRSAAQHMPELDIAVHATFLIEEKFKKAIDSKDDQIAGVTNEVT